MTGTLSGAMGFDTIGWVRQSNTYQNWDGLSISRFLVLDDHVSSGDREDAEAWLAWEYGLQTASNAYLPSNHAGYQTDPRTSIAPAFSSDIDISSLGADTWSSYTGPNTSTISGTIDIVPVKAYKAGTVTIEILLSY